LTAIDADPSPKPERNPFLDEAMDPTRAITAAKTPWRAFVGAMQDDPGYTWYGGI
jgi:hypothetical protein